MPLLITSGFPASGKTSVVNRIIDALKERGVENAVLITDASVNSEFSRSADLYLDRRKNIDHTNALRSEVMRLLTADSKAFVILDSLNYARSQRYELYTIAKNNRTTFCILFCDADKETTDWLNGQRSEDAYESNVIEDLRARYERPRPHLNGEKPLLELSIARPDDPLHGSANTPRDIPLPIDDLYQILVAGKPMVANHCATTAQKLSTNFIHEIDSTTTKIVKHIIENQHSVGMGADVVMPWNVDARFPIRKIHTFVSLNRHRTRFIDMARRGLVSEKASVDRAFVEYLSSVEG